MSSVRKTRVTRSIGDPGRWQAQYFDDSMSLWFDIGDSKATEAEASEAEARYRVARRLPTDQGERLPKLVTVCAYRILPGDVVWGIEHDGGFHITEPYTVDKGAIPIDDSGEPATGPGSTRVDLGPVTVTNSKLMLVEVR
jgi:hypothetical protein